MLKYGSIMNVTELKGTVCNMGPEFENTSTVEQKKQLTEEFIMIY